MHEDHGVGTPPVEQPDETLTHRASFVTVKE